VDKFSSSVNAVNDVPMKNRSTDAASSHIALTVAAAFFMETLDATIIVTALPAIGIGFGISTLDASLSYGLPHRDGRVHSCGRLVR
jgi:hypothetical protein